ncbi:NosR/NirI family protein [Sinisalibacter aestuarii]|uniref:FMN-binding protein n=1 Tax=Sinisalibacter aestuarii TaxID=2949426 RepID=A0ABQ5LX55_9RHOB|nr:NosR/NirI family protein [Sinisalibacter aestuarii]GKY89570.1 FMN-binding protein [Sinisalibacter aestuarii]
MTIRIADITTAPFRRLWLAAALLAALLCSAILAPARAQSDGAATASLLDRLTPPVLAAIYPGVTRLAMVADDGPVSAEAYIGDDMVGYVFSTLDVVRAPGYSSTPFDVVAGVTMDGTITGAVVLFHREPYLLNDRRRTEQLMMFLDALEGGEARLGAATRIEPGFVAGATISARAMRNAVQESARMVLRYRTEDFVVTEPTIDMINFKPMSPEALVGDGGLAIARVTNADVIAALERAGLGDLLPEVPMTGGPDNTYIDFVAGYANPPRIGRNGVGLEPYDTLINGTPEGTMGIFVASLHGVYDHRGTRLNNLSNQFRLDRVSVTQGRQSYEFTKSDVIFARQQIADILLLPKDAAFDPMKPWRADLYATALRPDGQREPFVLASLDYTLPQGYILMPEPTPPPVWVEPWVNARVEIAILAAALTVLTGILTFQAKLSQYRRVHRYLRTGFLLFTLVWIGWIASAQLSIVHLINYLKAPFADLGLAFYLAEPLIVILSIYTAISLVLLGRGVFCGWLCPFGALQELLANLARALKLRQWNPPERLQRHLWMGKYLSLGLILTLVVFAPEAAPVAEEIEPFKTAITAMFVRGLPYVIYALALLTIGLFTERAFCRFLCPLGGALAVLDRLHMVDLLKRRPECGNPCHLCERSCPVRAIERSGKIVMAECFQCLDCQVEYYDDRRCPPLAKARKQRERAARQPAAAPAMPGLVLPKEATT